MSPTDMDLSLLMVIAMRSNTAASPSSNAANKGLAAEKLQIAWQKQEPFDERNGSTGNVLVSSLPNAKFFKVGFALFGRQDF